ncbi:heme ABC transporter ATP-binding protein [Salirhabdus sp. Marseille-P4669]|uniref:heme ABC transporter ATP-binding protein n=1 Tax=Salirhabdus sp. Marseille-P4669 TaxID=2042310 RepID=UPI000C7C241D|nr:heme ABC transporter ATP-binding protein [Salirhabdus sp. Marseille-P4669]
MLTVQNISKHYKEQVVLKNISFQVKEGTCFGIIGPNGVGKSTLLKIISGLIEPSSGKIMLRNKELASISQKKLAREMAVLSQSGLPTYPLSVEDTIMMGRYPHLHWYEREGKKDKEIVERVMEQTGVTSLREKLLDTLSGGERQRVAIAKAMVQQPKLLLLDEPTTYLDIHHQLVVLQLVKKWQKEAGLTVVMVMHDLNLASQFCDQLLLLNNGGIEKVGSIEEVIEKDTLSKVYETVPEIIEHPINKVPQVLLTALDELS